VGRRASIADFRAVSPPFHGLCRQCIEYGVRFAEYLLGGLCRPCSARPLAGSIFPCWGRGDAMENVKTKQSEQAVVEDFLDELLDEALDRNERDVKMCTCSDSVCDTKCI
jgi:hypothetical protein